MYSQLLAAILNDDRAIRHKNKSKNRTTDFCELAVIRGDNYKACQIMLKDKKAVINSTIEVEKINGSILLMSAANDEVWPSKYMSDEIVARLKRNQFKHYYEHFSFEGNHTGSSKHFDVVFKFLDEHFKANQEQIDR